MERSTTALRSQVEDSGAPASCCARRPINHCSSSTHSEGTAKSVRSVHPRARSSRRSLSANGTRSHLSVETTQLTGQACASRPDDGHRPCAAKANIGNAPLPSAGVAPSAITVVAKALGKNPRPTTGSEYSAGRAWRLRFVIVYVEPCVTPSLNRQQSGSSRLRGHESRRCPSHGRQMDAHRRRHPSSRLRGVTLMSRTASRAAARPSRAAFAATRDRRCGLLD